MEMINENFSVIKKDLLEIWDSSVRQQAFGF